RSPYLVTKALKTFMWGSILAAVSSQIATTTDAIVVSNLIGPDAISAINLMMPVLTLFSALMILFGIGSSVVAAKAIGRRDEKEANGVFTTAILTSLSAGVALAMIVFIFSDIIVAVLTGGDPRIYELALNYLQAMCVAIPFLMMAGVIENFVKTDGNPKLVMTAVIAGSLLNLILDIVFVKFLGMGIAGSAWATGLNYVLAIGICLVHFRKPTHSLKWSLERSRLKFYVKQSVTQGLPMSVNSLFLGGCIMLINYIVLGAQGSDGIYCWSVCMQIFMIMQMVLTGIGSSIYAIGGIMMGEQDMEGLSILNRKCLLYACGSLSVITVLIIIFPEFFGELFGNRSNDPINFLPIALRAFSIMLVPYSLVALLRATYQILGHIKLSLALSVLQLLLMVSFVWGFSYINPVVLWWGFPSSSMALLIGLVIYTITLHLKNRSLAAFSLIPEVENNESMNLSVKIDRESLEDALKQIAKFLSQNLDELTAYRVRLSCEELMYNILDHAVKKNPEKHYFDIHIRIEKDNVNLLIKDDGRPFNPIIREENIKVQSADPSDRIGLKIVNSTAESIDYKYMYNQNISMLKFQRTS
ncbi:MAG: ATP-binding protein, partial [Muribaculaceae bacterium]|nr:ATP-binding protein [Muribaculaceae bacterium]